MKIFHTLLRLLCDLHGASWLETKEQWAHSRNVVYKFSILMLSIYTGVDAVY